MAFRMYLNKIMNILHSPVPAWNCHLFSKSCLRQTLKPITSTEIMHVQRQATLKDINFVFSNRENEMTRCEGSLKPPFNSQPHRSPGLRDSRYSSHLASSQQCVVPGRAAAIPGSVLLGHLPSCVLWVCVAEPCPCLKPESLITVQVGKPRFSRKRIRPSFAASVTYPISERESA